MLPMIDVYLRLAIMGDKIAIFNKGLDIYYCRRRPGQNFGRPFSAGAKDCFIDLPSFDLVPAPVIHVTFPRKKKTEKNLPLRKKIELHVY